MRNKDDVPGGSKCYSLQEREEGKRCNCEFDCSCKVNLVKKLCPNYVYLDDGLTKCTLINITSEDDESFVDQIKVCGFNECDEIS